MVTKIGNVSFRLYFLHKKYSNPYVAYKPNMKFGIKDFTGFVYFLFLPLMRSKTLFFISGRTDLIQYSEQIINELNIDRHKIFIRSEVLQGNSFFIESIRYIFRLFANFHFIFRKKNSYKDRHLLVNFLGDYFFETYFLSFFLKKHKVYFTNCVIPLFSKYSNVLNLTELQHGVIHDSHHNYKHNQLSCNMIVWDKKTSDTLLAMNSMINKIIIIKKKYKLNLHYIKNSIIIYTTVSDYFSNRILDEFNQKNVILKKHPRDYFDYRDFKGDVIFNDEFLYYSEVVYCSDTSLINDFIDNQVFFIYLKLYEDSIMDIVRLLKNKYGAIYKVDYDIQ